MDYLWTVGMWDLGCGNVCREKVGNESTSLFRAMNAVLTRAVTISCRPTMCHARPRLLPVVKALLEGRYISLSSLEGKTLRLGEVKRVSQGHRARKGRAGI